MLRGILPLTLCSLPRRGAAPVALAQAAAPITEQEAHAIAVDAYIYFYPLHVDGRVPEAIHQRHATISRAR